MAYVYGRETSVGFGEESTWGTAVSRTHWYRCVSVNAAKRTVKEIVPVLANSAGSWAPQRTYVPREEVRITMRLISQYDGMGLLYKHIFWGTPATTGSGPYVHTYECGATLAPGLTVEVIRGTASNSEVYEGCMISKATFSCEAGGLMYLDLEFIGQTSAARAAKGTPAYNSSEELVKHHQAGTLAWNSRTLTLRSFRFVVDTKLAERQQLGAVTTGQPAPSAPWSIMLDAELDSDTSYGDGLYQDAHDDDQGDAVLTFTGPSSQALAFTAFNAKLMSSADTDISAVGVVNHTISLIGLTDGTDEGAKLVATNSSSSATAV